MPCAKLLYAAHVHCGVTEAEVKRYKDAYTYALRAVVGKEADLEDGSRMTAAEVHATAGRGDFCGIIAAARLRYLTRFVQQAPDCLYALLQGGRGCKGSWVTCIEEDWRWLVKFSPKGDMPGGDSKWEQRQRYVKQDKKFKRKVTAALQRHHQHGAAIKAVEVEQDAISKQLTQAGVLGATRGQLAGEYHCYECGKSFRTPQGLGIHCVRKHAKMRMLSRAISKQKQVGTSP